MRNKTSGKYYAGQTVAQNMDWYCGSGGYWVPHCEKHGGYDRTNIEVVEQTWFTEESEAQAWLDALEAAVPDYWCGNPQWANRILENTDSSSFAGEAGSKLQRERVENGTHPWAGEAGSKLQRERVEMEITILQARQGVRMLAKTTVTWLPKAFTPPIKNYASRTSIKPQRARLQTLTNSTKAAPRSWNCKHLGMTFVQFVTGCSNGRKQHELAAEIAARYPHRRKKLLEQLELRHEHKGSEDVAVEFAVRRKLGLMPSGKT